MQYAVLPSKSLAKTHMRADLVIHEESTCEHIQMKISRWRLERVL